MGALGRTDGHLGEVQEGEGVGGDGGGYGGLAPVRERAVDQVSRGGEAGYDDTGPEHLDYGGLGGRDVAKAVDGGGVQELPQDFHDDSQTLKPIQCRKMHD